MATAFLSGQPWLMLNKSRFYCQVQRIHSEIWLWTECIIVSRTVPQDGRGCVCHVANVSDDQTSNKTILFEFSLLQSPVFFGFFLKIVSSNVRLV